MSHLKLMKLMYLAERESLGRYGFPLTEDALVSMPHGPVLSQTLNHIDGDVESGEDGWDAWVSAKADHEVEAIERPPAVAELDELSNADLTVLADVWGQFGGLDKYAIRDYSHKLPEWDNPHGSSKPIALQRVFQAFGYGDADIASAVAGIAEQKNVDQVFRGR